MLAVGLTVFILACGEPNRKEASAKPSPTVTRRPSVVELRLDSPAEPAGSKISDVSHDPTAIHFKLTFVCSGKIPMMDHPLIFCVPPDRTIVPEIASYKIGLRDYSVQGIAIVKDGQISSKAIQVRNLGVMRRWTLVALDFAPEFFSAFSSLDHKDWGDLTAEIVLRWDKPVELNAQAVAPREVVPEMEWGSVGSHLVANPDGLKLFQLAEPPLKEGVKPTLTAPWKMIQGQRHWARLRLKDEGIHRLKPESLNVAGFAPNEIRPASIRLFSHEKPVPLLRVGEGADQKIYLWNPQSDSRYTPERIYWATPGDDLPDPLLKPLDPATNPELFPKEIQPHPLTTRTALLKRDREVKIETGSFLMVHRIEWVDAPIKSDAPLQAPLEFPGYAAPSGNLTARLTFYAEDSAPFIPSDVILLAGSRKIGSVRLMNREELTQTISIPPPVIHNGRNEWSLALAPRPASQKSEPEAPLWFDRMEVNYPSQPTLAEGRLTLGDEGTTPALCSAWTPIDPAVPPAFSDALAFLVSSRETKPSVEPNAALGVIPLAEREGRKGFLWPSGSGDRVEIYDSKIIPDTPPFETVETDDLTAEDQGADELIIAHREFMDSAKRIAQLKEKRGMKTRLAEIQSVYDQFSHGELTPLAIRDFLAYTLGHWRIGAPQDVLLIGDCTSDYLNQLHCDVKNWVPSYSFPAGGEQIASDTWFGVVAGPDDLPDFMIGRISVASREDADTIADKIINYVEHPNLGPWRARTCFVADNDGFVPPAEEIRKDHTPPAYEQSLDYLDEHKLLQVNWYLSPQVVAQNRLKVCPQLTAKIRDDFVHGLSYLNYYGHGSPNIWMEERVWFGGNSPNSDNQLLTDSGYPAFVVNMTCNTGAIDYPEPKGLPGRGDKGGWNICISEDMMRVKNGGAIALWVPSGPGVTGVQQKMAIELHRALFEDRLRGLGELTTLAKARYLAQGLNKDLSYMFILLGDPAMDLLMTSHVATFQMPSKYYRPGDSIRADLTDISPAVGRFVASLETADESTLWHCEEKTYQNGRIPLEISIPPNAPPGPVHLRLYAWGDKSQDDVAAAASFEIAVPKLEKAEAQEDTQTKRPSHLRIRPGSIHIEPEKPFDGQTVIFHFSVENVGDLPTGSFTAGVFGGDPAREKTPLPSHIAGCSKIACEALPDGQSRELLLRWDPVDNAGEQTVWIGLDEPRATGDSTPEDLKTAITFHVRKKEELVKGETRLEQIKNAAGETEYWLSGEVLNKGETDAHNVLVVFYRGDPKTPENEMGRILLPLVPAMGRETARLQWKPDPAKDLTPGAPLPKPTHNMRLNWRRSVGP